MSLKQKTKERVKRCFARNLLRYFFLYEIHVSMVDCQLESGSKLAYFHEYPNTIEDAIVEIEQRRKKIILFRDALLERFPETKDLITEQRLLGLKYS